MEKVQHYKKSKIAKASTFSDKRAVTHVCHGDQILNQLKMSSQGNYTYAEKNQKPDQKSPQRELYNFLHSSKKIAKNKKMERQGNSIQSYLLGLKNKFSSTIKERKGEGGINSGTLVFLEEEAKGTIIPNANENNRHNTTLLHNHLVLKNNFLDLIKKEENLVDQIFSNRSSQREKSVTNPLVLNSDNKKIISSGLSFRKKESKQLEEENKNEEKEIVDFKIADTSPFANKQNIDDNYYTELPKYTETEMNTKGNYNRELKKFDNVYDSMSDEGENELVDENNNCLIHPESQFKIIWDGICSLLILYSIVLTPYRLAFQRQEESTSEANFYVELLIDYIFMVDLVMNFFTPYYRNDTLVTSSKAIVMNYLKSWFIIDLLASIPIGFVYLIINGLTEDGSSQDLKTLKSLNSISRFLRFYRLLKWIRIFRVLKLSSKGTSPFWKHITNIFDNNFFKFLISFLILVYVTSCIWCFLGKMDDIVLLFQDNWIMKNQLDGEEDSTIFVTAIYFVCTTIFTIGYGDITAANWLEKLFLVFLMIVGSLTWSFVLTSLSYLFTHKKEKEITFEKKMEILDDLNLEYKLDEKTISRLRKYLYYEFQTYNRDQVSFLETLPSNLKNKLYLNMYEDHISNLLFFKDQSYDFIVCVLPLLKYVNYLKGECIISIGNIVEGVYMVHFGMLGIYLGPFHENYEIAKIVSSYHIGDILMYSDDQSPYNVKVKSKRAELLVLSKSDFANLKLSFKEAVKKILKKSHDIYKEIEKKKEAALIFFNSHKTVKGFKYKPIGSLISGIDSYKTNLKRGTRRGTIMEEDEEYEEDFEINEERKFQDKFNTNYKNLVSVVNSYSKLSKNTDKLRKELSFIELDPPKENREDQKSTLEHQENENKGEENKCKSEEIIEGEKISKICHKNPENKESHKTIETIKTLTNDIYIPTNFDTISKDEKVEISPNNPFIVRYESSDSSNLSMEVTSKDDFRKLTENFLTLNKSDVPDLSPVTPSMNNHNNSIFIINNLNMGCQTFVRDSNKSDNQLVHVRKKQNISKTRKSKLSSQNTRKSNKRSTGNSGNFYRLQVNSTTEKDQIRSNATPFTPKSRDQLLREKSMRFLRKEPFQTNLSEQNKVLGSAKPRKSVAFLNSIYARIENDAIMFKNKEIMSEYLKDVLTQEKREDSIFKSVFGKLDKLENKLKGLVNVKSKK